MTEFISNTAAYAMIFPIAFSTAVTLGIIMNLVILATTIIVAPLLWPY